MIQTYLDRTLYRRYHDSELNYLFAASYRANPRELGGPDPYDKQPSWCATRDSAFSLKPKHVRRVRSADHDQVPVLEICSTCLLVISHACGAYGGAAGTLAIDENVLPIRCLPDRKMLSRNVQRLGRRLDQVEVVQWGRPAEAAFDLGLQLVKPARPAFPSDVEREFGDVDFRLVAERGSRFVRHGDEDRGRDRLW